MATPFESLLRHWAEYRDLGVAEEVLSWDQETNLPPKGHEARARAMGTLAGARHRILVSAELSETLGELSTTDLHDEAAAQVREARREVDRARLLPEELVREIAEASTTGVADWVAAREARDFAPFARAMEKMVELKRREAETLALGDEAYDSLLDDFEPGARAARIEPIFDELADTLPDIVAEAADSGVDIDETLVRGSYPAVDQLVLCTWVAERFGFDFDRGRLDRSTHPFCVGMDPDDVRITWRPDLEDLRPGLFGVMHETGHGLYEQGLPTRWRRQPLGTASSMSVHESQSRLWENHVGRHRAFVGAVWPKLSATVPTATGLDPDSFWRTLHKIQPSLIRVEADEVTYHLHIVVRFRLERALLRGELAVADLPGAWDDAYEALLGIRPNDNFDGVLQDIHWASGLFGYFPTYSLGSLLSAQLFECAEADLGDLSERFSRLELAPLLEWLREKVHRHGARYTPPDLAERATGAPLGTAAFLRHVERKLDDVYRTSSG